MRCDKCGRLVLARDARIMDAKDSRARVEFQCECGAAHSCFIGDTSWHFGLTSDDAPGLVCNAEYCNTKYGRLRWLFATNPVPMLKGQPAVSYLMMIAEDDPRELGDENEAFEEAAEYLSGLPKGIWHQTYPQFPMEKP